jgi:DNA-binding transcriptional regulator YdaS (Cro superfamily)
MDLREYLFRKRMTVTDFSKLIDYSRTHISEIIHGTRRPGKKVARIIEKATNGEVTAEELLKEKIE